MSNNNMNPPNGTPQQHHYPTNQPHHKNNRRSTPNNGYNNFNPQQQQMQQPQFYQNWQGGFMPQNYLAPQGYPYNYYPQQSVSPQYFTAPMQVSPTLQQAQPQLQQPVAPNLTIKKKNGEAVTFAKGHTKAPSYSSAKTSTSSTPVLQKASIATVPAKVSTPSSSSSQSAIVAPIPETATPTSPAAAATPIVAKAAPNDAQLAFKAAILAAMQKKKQAAASSPASTTEAEPKEALKAEVTPKEEPKVDSPSEKEPVQEKEESTAELPTEEPKEVPTEQPKVEETKEASKEEPKEESKEEPKVEVAETIEPAVEEPKAEAQADAGADTEAEVQSTPADAKTPSTEETEEPKEETTEIPTAEPKAEEEEEEQGPTMSMLLEKLAVAKPIDNIYNFDYKGTETLPDPSLSKSLKKKYDPKFLMQFQSICNFTADAKWIEDFGSKIIVNIRKDSSKDRGGFGRSNTGFGKGGQNGPGGSMSRNQTLRGDFNGSRNGSRGGSKKKLSGDPRAGPTLVSTREKSQRQNSKRPRGDRRDRGDEREPKKEDDTPPIPAADIKPLEKTATRWVPRSQRKKEKEVIYAPDGVTVLLDSEDVEAKVKSLLNKMTLENFQDIANDIIQIANQSQWEDDYRSLNQVIELTFAKACDEPHWSSMYAKFCTELVRSIDPKILNEEKDEEKKEEKQTFADLAANGPPRAPAPPRDPRQASNLFVRTLLLSRCQHNYERGWKEALPTNEDGTPYEPEILSDEYYQIAAAKRRGLGLVKFIGELYALNLLGRNIILYCVKDQFKNTTDPSEDTLETLTQLLITTGPKLDAAGPEFLNHQFEIIKTMIKTAPMSSRIKFKLMDLIDLRENHWRDANKEAGPKTIAEIHQEAEAKRIQEEQKRRKGDSRSNSSRSNSKWGNNEKISSNEISKVGHMRSSSDRLGPYGSKKSKGLPSSSNLKNLNSSSNSNGREFMTVSNNNTSNYVPRLASSSNVAAASPEKEEPRAPSNRFAALLADDEDESEDDAHVEETEDAEDVAEEEVEVEVEAEAEEAPVEEDSEKVTPPEETTVSDETV
ncbi:hypothetical protein CANARDRAFT_23331 [[Candida] arabinofermentans NRRL YB-2248]|uniref:MIF4G domain-containing protein n=1 Tax=[Candida] arabinofermentans NRRL YB-2248 TaxID=983967 RepID=A0A1E4T0J6_9ASCO|nr:hypothetical protein CANARDRAFT_23331 [[Candida] arabinofermentans NRRL YB-2248]